MNLPGNTAYRLDLRRGTWFPYFVALASVTLVVLLRILLRALVDYDAALVLLTAAAVFSAWYGGLRPGLAATVAGAFAGGYYLVPSLYSLKPERLGDAITLGLFVVEGVTVSYLAGALRVAKMEAESSAGRIHEILASISDAFLAIDRDLRLVYVNAAAERMIDKSVHAVLGDSITQAYTGIAETSFDQSLREVMDRGRPSSFELRDQARGRWYEFNVYPLNTGASLYAKNVTDRRHAEEERDKLVEQLTAALTAVKLLSGPGSGKSTNDVGSGSTLVLRLWWQPERSPTKRFCSSPRYGPTPCGACAPPGSPEFRTPY